MVVKLLLAGILNKLGKTEYSTTEKVVGKWIDGKPLYRKVVDCGTLPNNSEKYASTGIAYSVMQPVNFFAFGRLSGGGFQFASFIGWNNENVRCFLTSYNNETAVRIITNSNFGAYNVYAIIEYTKTTD